MMKDFIGNVINEVDANKIKEKLAENDNGDKLLSRIVRPVSLLSLLSVVVFTGVASCFGYNPDPLIFGEISLVLGSAFGFYFNSKKAERIADKNTQANIKIEQMKIDKDSPRGRFNIRPESKASRRSERDQEIED